MRTYAIPTSVASVALLLALGCGGSGDRPGTAADKNAAGQKAADGKAAAAEQAAALAKQKAQSARNLAQIGLAFHSYHDTYKKLPGAAYIDPSAAKNPTYAKFASLFAAANGEEIERIHKFSKGPDGKPVVLPLLSWRVALLPYLGEGALYKEFKLDEPWDSEHNKKLLAKMPRVFTPVRGQPQEPYSTYYQVFVGKDAPFDGTMAKRIPASFPDGTSFTFLAAEAGEAVPWTKPADIPYVAKGPLPKLGGLFEDGFHVVMVDGSVRYILRDTPERTLRLLIMPADGEVVELPGALVKLSDE